MAESLDYSDISPIARDLGLPDRLAPHATVVESGSDFITYRLDLRPAEALTAEEVHALLSAPTSSRPISAATVVSWMRRLLNTDSIIYKQILANAKGDDSSSLTDRLAHVRAKDHLRSIQPGVHHLLDVLATTDELGWRDLLATPYTESEVIDYILDTLPRLPLSDLIYIVSDPKLPEFPYEFTHLERMSKGDVEAEVRAYIAELGRDSSYVETDTNELLSFVDIILRRARERLFITAPGEYKGQEMAKLSLLRRELGQRAISISRIVDYGLSPDTPFHMLRVRTYPEELLSRPVLEWTTAMGEEGVERTFEVKDRSSRQLRQEGLPMNPRDSWVQGISTVLPNLVSGRLISSVSSSPEAEPGLRPYTTLASKALVNSRFIIQAERTA